MHGVDEEAHLLLRDEAVLVAVEDVEAELQDLRDLEEAERRDRRDELAKVDGLKARVVFFLDTPNKSNSVKIAEMWDVSQKSTSTSSITRHTGAQNTSIGEPSRLSNAPSDREISSPGNCGGFGTGYGLELDESGASAALAVFAT